jgi:ribonucleoside-diphosphate reductase alpha chain
MQVTKLDGSLQNLDYQKIHAMVEICAAGIENVSVSDVIMGAKLNFYDGISTQDIQTALVKSAENLMTARTPNYSLLAGRLLLTQLRKQVWGEWSVPHLSDIVVSNSLNGFYDSELFSFYTGDEWDELNDYINHDRDLDYTSASIQQFKDKYSVKNRVTGQIYETPQVAYMLIAAAGFAHEDKSIRMQFVKDAYDAFSTETISLATPIRAGMRTKTKQYASCVLMAADDDLDSIMATQSALMKYVTLRAGIGMDFGRWRALNASIRNGEGKYTGAVGFLKAFEATLNSCSQGHIRKGSSTMFYPIWHKDVLSFLPLTNGKGTEETRTRGLDYGIAISKIFYERLQNGQDITLFDPNDVKAKYNLYENFGLEAFNSLYLAAEADSSIPKTTISASKLWTLIAQERGETGQVYILNIDHLNTHSSFSVPISQSNLCVAPETKILTSKGYETISNLEGKSVKVWNGEEWSKTTVLKTSEKSELLKLVIDNYESIECTPYHKFYVVTRYPRHNETIEDVIREVRASDLKVGDKLIKFDLPVIEGSLEFESAYAKGIYTGDGSQSEGIAFVDLYGKKKLLLQYLPTSKVKTQDTQDRLRATLEGILPEDKFVVPTAEYTIKSRIEWLAGLVDTDGHIVKNGTNCGLQIASIHLDFLKNLKLMLQTLGVNSKILFGSEAGKRLLPNGHGGSAYYNCKNSYRLQVSSSGFQTLLALGLKEAVHNHEFDAGIPNREATRYSKVTSVEKTGREDATYCFTEPLRHKGMFNGFLTGQCMEISLPTKPFYSLTDSTGEIATCILGAINPTKIKGRLGYQKAARIIVRFLDNIIEYQNYPFVMSEIGSKGRRSIGVGFNDFAHWLALNELQWGSDEMLKAVHTLTETHQYYLLKASNELAIEKGACSKFDETKYSLGILPIDTYYKNVDNLVEPYYESDWEKLRESILEYGLRNSTVTAAMPCESSSLTGSGSTNGIEPPRSAIGIKDSSTNTLKFAIPDVDKVEYEYAWSFSSNEAYLNTVAVIQKFFDQSISANTYYNPLLYPDSKVPLQVVLDDLIYAYSIGLKSLYYHNTHDMSNNGLSSSSCSSGACAL